MELPIAILGVELNLDPKVCVNILLEEKDWSDRTPTWIKNLPV